MNIRLTEYIYYLQSNDSEKALAALTKDNNIYTLFTNLYNKETAEIITQSLKMLVIANDTDFSVVPVTDPEVFNNIKLTAELILSHDFSTIYNNKTLMTITALALLEYYYEIDKTVPNTTETPITKNIGYTYLVLKRHCNSVELYNNMLSWLNWYEDKSKLEFNNIGKSKAELLNRAIWMENAIING